MSKNSVKISSNFGESISTHDHLHPKSPGSESGKNLNNIQVIKEKKEELNNNNNNIKLININEEIKLHPP